MAWNNQGGPWGGGGKSPWGRGTGPSGGGGGNRPPDFEEMLRRGQDRMKSVLPGGVGSWRGLALVVAAIIAIWLATGFYVVNPGQVGVNMVFGAFWRQTEPGWYWNAPWPIGYVIKPDVAQRKRTEIGFNSVGGDADREVPEESLMLTGDENIVDVRVIVLWRIEDVRKYLFEIDQPETSVKNAAEAALREIVGQSKFQETTTEKRGEIEARAKELSQKILDTYNSGIRIEELSMQKVDAPQEVRDAFLDVQRAKADRVSSVNQAQAYVNKILQDAQGQAVQIVKQAEAYKAQKIALAQGDAQRFLSVYEQYKVNPSITERRLYLDTMSEVFGNMNKVLVDPSTSGSGVIPYLPLDQLVPKGTPRISSAPQQSVPPGQPTPVTPMPGTTASPDTGASQ
jgi:membrane protease subunit HflK